MKARVAIAATLLSGIVALGAGAALHVQSPQGQGTTTAHPATSATQSQKPEPPAGTRTITEPKAPSKSRVDYRGDLSYHRPTDPDSIYIMVGNIAMHHNGTFIECDSAVRYSDSRLEGFGNVLISQDSTLIYGDHILYDGTINTARITSPLIKVISGSAVMWIQNKAEFNTLTNTATYTEGGIIIQKDNILESQRGSFNSNTNEAKALGFVSMRDDNYKMRTDSLSYNLDSETVTFLAKTYIWDKDRDFLTSDRGNYFRRTQTYFFTHNAYVMTPDREFWGDSIEYHSLTREVVMYGHIQMTDTTQNMLGFGDYGLYNDSLGTGILTRKPSIISFEEPARDSLGNLQAPDSSFTRADAFYFETYQPGQSKPAADSLQSAADEAFTDYEETRGTPGRPEETALPEDTRPAEGIIINSLDTTSHYTPPQTDATQIAVDRIDSILNNREQLHDILEETTAGEDTIRPVPDFAQADNHPAGGDIGTVEASPGPAKEPTLPEDTTASASVPADSLRTLSADSLRSLPIDSLPPTEKKDTLERIIRAYHHVKLFRADAQAICDSAVFFSVDSSANLFGRPILWSQQSQLTADRIDIYSRNEALDYADFIGSPFVTEKAHPRDTMRFNQAQGRFMKAWFRDNAVYKALLTGNVFNYYYDLDQKINRLDKLATVTSASLTIYIENQEPTLLKWEGETTGKIFPIHKIPEAQPQRLQGFTWSPEKRPADRYEIHNRPIRDSERAEASQYGEPVFEIEVRTFHLRDNLIKGGLWRDRVDQKKFTLEQIRQNEKLY